MNITFFYIPKLTSVFQEKNIQNDEIFCDFCCSYFPLPLLFPSVNSFFLIVKKLQIVVIVEKRTKIAEKFKKLQNIQSLTYSFWQ